MLATPPNKSGKAEGTFACIGVLIVLVAGGVAAVKGWSHGRLSAGSESYTSCMKEGYRNCGANDAGTLKMLWWGLVFAVVYAVVAMVVAGIVLALIAALSPSAAGREMRRDGDNQRKAKRAAQRTKAEVKSAQREEKRRNLQTPASQAGRPSPGGGLACPSCGGTQWKAGRRIGRPGTAIAAGVLILPVVGVGVAAASSRRVVRCITCNATFKRG